jgi:hypothetical protein
VHRYWILLGVAVLGLPGAFATAILNNRSAVASTGLDTNPCTVASPCRSFSVAIAVTNPGGEIIALDSAGYGVFTIGMTVTVSGAPGVHAAITATSGNAITINAAVDDDVTIKGLVLIGSGATNGVQQVQAEEVRILDCLIRGFNTNGIEVLSGGMTVDHCTILDQKASQTGIKANSDGTLRITLTVANSLINFNGHAISVFGNASALITHCTMTENSTGVYVASASSNGSVHASATIESSTIAHGGYGLFLQVGGPLTNQAIVYLAQNEISYNTLAALAVNAAGCLAYSFGNNRLAANNSDGPAMTPIAMK